MRLILFLSRVAFICNLAFLLAATLHLFPFIKDGVLLSTIVILGYALAVAFFSPLVNLIYLWLLVFKKSLFHALPRWLVAANFLFLILQIIYIILFLNESFFSYQ